MVILFLRELRNLWHGPNPKKHSAAGCEKSNSMCCRKSKSAAVTKTHNNEVTIWKMNSNAV